MLDTTPMDWRTAILRIVAVMEKMSSIDDYRGRQIAALEERIANLEAKKLAGGVT